MRPDDIEGILRDTLRHEVKAAAPRLDGLEDRIVAELGDRLPRLRFADWLKELVAPTRTGRLGQIAVLGATAAVFLIAGTLITQNRPLGPTLEPAFASRASHEILFVVPALDAGSVAVVGDFNAWEATPLSDDNQDGIWTASIPLSPGRYEYAFVIDGRWWGQDPLADEYVRTFGQYSSVRYVGGGGDGV
ncbi:MAG: isoamylase early set domain-containing protein [Candidatus Bipolaricaulia bacterium]